VESDVTPNGEEISLRYARAFFVGGKDLDPKIPSRFVNDFAELS
jgi:hypothetical protein